MKKFLFGIILIALIATGVFGYFKYQNQTKRFYAEEILPEGAFVYSKTTNVSRLLSYMASTEFWQTLTNIDIPLLMAQSGYSKSEFGFIQLLKAVFSNELSQKTLKQFFGRELAMAIYPTSISVLDEAAVKKILTSIVFVTLPETGANFHQFISNFILGVGKQVVVDTTDYEEYTITSFDLFQLGFGELTLSYVYLNEYLVIGFNEDAAKRCIDVLKKNSRKLSADENFKLAQAQFLGNSHNVGYVNVELVYSGLRNQILSLAQMAPETSNMTEEEVKKGIDEGLGKLAGFKAVAFSTTIGPLTSMKTVLSFDRSQLDPEIQTIYSCEPKKNETINFVPKDVLYYQWNDCYDLNYYWQQAKAEIEKSQRLNRVDQQQPDLSQGLTGFETATGLSIEEDIIPAFGQEFGGFLKEITTTNVFPIPQGSMFVKIASRQKADKLLDRLLSNQAGFIQFDSHKGVEIKYVTIPIAVGLEPGFCYIEDYLVISSSRGLLKNSIDVLENSQLSLLANDSFKSVNKGLTDKSNSVFFVELKHIVQKTSTLLDWGSEWVLTKDKEKKAYRDGTRNRLADLIAASEQKEKELEDLEQTFENLKVERRKLEVTGANVSDIDTVIRRLEVIQAQIRVKEREVVASQEREEEQREVVMQLSQEQGIDSNLFRIYLYEGVRPLLKALEAISVVGSNMLFRGNTLESNVFMQVR